MKTCGTCKHRGSRTRTHRSGYVPAGFRDCGAVVHDKDSLVDDASYQDYGDDGVVLDLPPEAVAFREAHKAVAMDGSGYFAALRTREDFGCTLHEEEDVDRRTINDPPSPVATSDWPPWSPT